MDSRAAKEILFLYRGAIDDDDPRFAEALAQVDRDPELAEWLRQEHESYAAIHAKLHEIETPDDLREKILRQRPIPFPDRDVAPGWLKLVAAVIIFALGAGFWFSWHRPLPRARLAQGAEEITVTGEVLDMACYIANNLSGPEHADCARTCIKNGLPVGIKSKTDGKVYLLVGGATSLNGQLADYAAKTITIKGKLRTRDGFTMLDEVTIKNL
jgi:hypothetical protein